MENVIQDPHLLLDIMEGDIPTSYDVAQRIIRVERGMYLSFYAWYEAAQYVGLKPIRNNKLLSVKWNE